MDEVLRRLQATYPQFAITGCADWRGEHALWTAKRRDGADPGLYDMSTTDLHEFEAALAADAARYPHVLVPA